jgi:hypothetical protein
MQPDHCKPNKELTLQENKAKRALKKQLKIQKTRVRLENKLRHAMKRNDLHTEQETRVALDAFDEHNHTDTSSGKVIPLEEETPERQFLLHICSELQRKQSTAHDKDKKHCQTQLAKTLLRHMTKGSQEKRMFQDSNALWGYTRHKFFERAMLVCTSFMKLRESHEELWNRLRSVRRICSIGCGPGNDAVGVAAFLKETNSPNLERAVLMDWALEDWTVVVKPLEKIICPAYINTMDLSSCDVAESLLDSDFNRNAKQLLVNQPMDLFLISYLLTEVRGQWHDFVKDIIDISSPNTLYYCAEPTPWQLHVLRKSFEDQLEFMWIDSSMGQPHLQPLDNRVGPGVLLGRKR